MLEAKSSVTQNFARVYRRLNREVKEEFFSIGVFLSALVKH